MLAKLGMQNKTVRAAYIIYPACLVSIGTILLSADDNSEGNYVLAAFFWTAFPLSQIAFLLLAVYGVRMFPILFGIYCCVELLIAFIMLG